MKPWFQLEWKFADPAAKDWIHAHKNRATDGEKALAAIDSLARRAQASSSARPNASRPGIAAKARRTISNSSPSTIIRRANAADDQTSTTSASPAAKWRGFGKTLAAEMKKRGWTAADTAVCARRSTNSPPPRSAPMARWPAQGAGFPEKPHLQGAAAHGDIPVR